jgi:hypothetical protein
MDLVFFLLRVACIGTNTKNECRCSWPHTLTLLGEQEMAVLAYREDLRVTFSSFLARKENSKKKFERLWPHWILSTPRNENTFWPLQSIVSRLDVEYSVKQQEFHAGILVEDVMKACDVVYQRHNSCTIYRNPQPKKKSFFSLNNRQIDNYRSLYAQYSKYQSEQFQNSLLAQLCSFYNSLCGCSTHACVPPSALKALGLHNLVELFALPFNVMAEKYGSPLQLEKEYLGSLGNAFEVIHSYRFAPEAIIHIHPPFDVTTIDSICEKINGCLSRCPNIDIITLLPCWDDELQKQAGFGNADTPLQGFRMLQASTFRVETIVLDRYRFPFYDPFLQVFRPANHLVALLLSSREKEQRWLAKDPFHHYLEVWEQCASKKICN